VSSISSSRRKPNGTLDAFLLAGWEYVEPQINGSPSWFPSPGPNSNVYFKYKMDTQNYLTILDNPTNLMPDYTY
jgi:hypothetical protein